MNLKQVADILYVPYTESENRQITVRTIPGDFLLYQGKAKDLKFSDIMNTSWEVVQILVDPVSGPEVPFFNRAKIIKVV